MQFSKPNFNPTEQAVLKTLLYSDIFDFPLTKHELWKFLISPREIDKKLFDQALIDLVNVKPHRKRLGDSKLVFDKGNPAAEEKFLGISFADDLYCLTGNEK